jgi:hypothetical protein
MTRGPSAAVGEDLCPVRWAGRQAVVAFPARMDESNAGRVGGELLSVIGGGARVLIADMTASIWCDHAGAVRWCARFSGP